MRIGSAILSFSVGMLILCQAVYGAPISGDTFVDFESGSDGAQVTTTLLNSGYHGVGTWSIEGNAGELSIRSAASHAIYTPFTVGGTTYSSAGSRGLCSMSGAWNCATLWLPQHYVNLSVGLFIKFNGNIDYMVHDIIDLQDSAGRYQCVQLQDNPSWTALHVHTNNPAQNSVGNNVLVSVNHWYWITYHASTNGGTVELNVYDAENGYNLVGISTLEATVDQSPDYIRFGNFTPVCTGPKYSSMYVYYDNVIVSLEGIFPLGPGSGGTVNDTTPPSAPSGVNDGTGSDVDTTMSKTTLSANWSASTDPESTVSYKYAIGTTAGGTQTAGWTTNYTTNVTKTGLSLVEGTTYYFSVKAVSAGGESSARNSDGQYVQPFVKSLIAHWKLDEASPSASAADSSGKGNTGALSGSPAWSPSGGKISGALGLDGTDDYVNYGTNSILDFDANAEFTIAGWVKTTESYGPVLSQRNSANSGAIIEVAVGYDGAATSAGSLMALVRQDSGSSYARVTGGAVNNGAWHHFALKRNTSGGIELFLDGVSQGTNTSSQAAGAITTDLRALGSERRWVQDTYGTADQRYLSGSIDDVRIYNYALATAEIQALASASADTTPPGAPAAVRDGTGTTDINSTTSRAQLSANWTAATDAESGIGGYSYAIGTTAGATNIANWTSLGNVLTVTKTGLSLSVGTTYYFSVKAVNGAGLTGSAANSNGQVVISTAVADTTAPSSPATVRDGPTAGTDVGFTYSTTTLSANWTVASDGESGIANYQYAIGTAQGATNITNWVTLGNVLTATKTGLTLTVGTTYYFSVKAINGAGLTGTAANSNGQYVATVNTADTTPPSTIAQVNDGAEAGVDTNVTYLTDELSANWSSSADTESGISRYLYAIGTSAGGTNVTSGWKDNGELTEATETGLTLAVGTTYYFSVKAQNGVGLQCVPANSNGQFVLSMDTQGPQISNVSAQGITNAGATITWQTDEPATSRVEYGLTASYGSLTGEYLAMDTAHSVTLAGLAPATQYHFRVISRDYAGNASTSVDYTFTTLSTLNTQHSSNAYPNPCDFNNAQAVKFKVSEGDGIKEVSIYTMSGKLVRKLTVQSGANEISWDGKNEDGQKAARGVYIYRITKSGGETKAGKLAVKER